MMKSKWRWSPIFLGSSKTAMSTGKPTNETFFSRLVASDGLFGTRHSDLPKIIWSRLHPASASCATIGPTTFLCSGMSLSFLRISSGSSFCDFICDLASAAALLPPLHEGMKTCKHEITHGWEIALYSGQLRGFHFFTGPANLQRYRLRLRRFVLLRASWRGGSGRTGGSGRSEGIRASGRWV